MTTTRFDRSTCDEVARILAKAHVTTDRDRVDAFLELASAKIAGPLDELNREAAEIEAKPKFRRGPTVARDALETIARSLDAILAAAPKLGERGAEAILGTIRSRTGGLGSLPLHERALFLLAMTDEPDTLLSGIASARDQLRDAARSIVTPRGATAAPLTAAKQRHLPAVIDGILAAAEEAFGGPLVRKRPSWTAEVLAKLLSSPGLGWPANAEREIGRFKVRHALRAKHLGVRVSLEGVLGSLPWDRYRRR